MRPAAAERGALSVAVAGHEMIIDHEIACMKA